MLDDDAVTCIPMSAPVILAWAISFFLLGFGSALAWAWWFERILMRELRRTHAELLEAREELHRLTLAKGDTCPR